MSFLTRQRKVAKVVTIMRVYLLVRRRVEGEEDDAEEQVDLLGEDLLEEQLRADDVAEEEEAVDDDEARVDVDQEEVVDDEHQHQHPRGHLEGVQVQELERRDHEELHLAVIVAVGARAVRHHRRVLLAPPRLHEQQREVQDHHAHVPQHFPALGVDEVPVHRLEEPRRSEVVDLVHPVGVVLQQLQVLDVHRRPLRPRLVEPRVYQLTVLSHFIAVKA